MCFCIGIDLAAKEEKCTGFAVIEINDRARLIDTRCVYDNRSIVENITMLSNRNKIVIAIDAPFSFSVKGGYRYVDLKMISLGYRVLPPNMGGMRNLTNRAIELIKILKHHLEFVDIIETHPRSALKSSKCPTIQHLLSVLDIDFTIFNNNLVNNKDIVDAIIASVVAYGYVKNTSLAVEDVDGVIWILKKIC